MGPQVVQPNSSPSGDQVPIPEAGDGAHYWTASDPAEVPSEAPTIQSEDLSWTASEYVAHEKSATWYVKYGLIAVVLAAVIYFVSRDFISLAFVAVAAVAFGIFASRKPKVQTYHLGSTGIHIAERLYSFADFKSFALVKDGALHSIVLLPIKRFAPSLTVYFDPADEQAIASAMSSYLPQEQRKQDAVDSFMRRIRF